MSGFYLKEFRMKHSQVLKF